MQTILSSRRAVLFWAARFTTSSNFPNKRPRSYGKKSHSSRSEGAAIFADEDIQQSHIVSSRTTPSPFPPHISEEVQDAADVNAAASAATRGSPLHNYRSISTLKQSSSSAGSDSPESPMTSHEQQELGPGSNDAESENLSSPRSTSEVSAEIHKLGLGGRSASPAKRTFADSQDDEGEAQTTHGAELDSDRLPKYSNNGLRSPMPSRHKPMPSIEVNNEAYRDEPIESAGNDVGRGRMEVGSGIVHGQAKDIPSLDEQVNMIKDIVDSSEQREGEKGYVVAISWLNRVMSRTTTGLYEGFPKELREGDIGPVDNSSIVANGMVTILWSFDAQC